MGTSSSSTQPARMRSMCLCQSPSTYGCRVGKSPMFREMRKCTTPYVCPSDRKRSAMPRWSRISIVRECRPPAREPTTSWLARRSTIATSTPANVSSAASMSPVGPAPAITTACSDILAPLIVVVVMSARVAPRPATLRHPPGLAARPGSFYILGVAERAYSARMPSLAISQPSRPARVRELLFRSESDQRIYGQRLERRCDARQHAHDHHREAHHGQHGRVVRRYAVE